MKYTETILKNACSTPLDVLQLMEGAGGWESREACKEVERLELEGFIKEVKELRSGPFFQHRKFIKNA